MIEIVLWSCVLGFSPIVLSIGWRIIAMVVALSLWIAACPLALNRHDRLAQISARPG
jgi:hypothetical protein